MRLCVVLVIMTCYLVVSACKTSQWTIDDRMEGFRDNFFRVYVRLSLTNDAKEGSEIVSDSIIIDHAKNRAIDLLEIYIKTITDEVYSIEEIKTMISEVVMNCKIVYKDCNDKYCEAFIDFDIKESNVIMGEKIVDERYKKNKND